MIYLPEAGAGFHLDRFKAKPLRYRFLNYLERMQSAAEEKRLLYVAATRAREKLLVSGHTANLREGCWLRELLHAAEIDVEALPQHDSGRITQVLPCGQPVGLWLFNGGDTFRQTIRANEDYKPLPDRHLGIGQPLFR
jgi:hypothetical protein